MCRITIRQRSTARGLIQIIHRITGSRRHISVTASLERGLLSVPAGLSQIGVDTGTEASTGAVAVIISPLTRQGDLVLIRQGGLGLTRQVGLGGRKSTLSLTLATNGSRSEE